MSASGQIVLQKSFGGDNRNFSGPLMRFGCGDMRDHSVSHQNNHGASYRRYAVLQRRSWLKINSLRDFRRRSIFDFCNSIGHLADTAVWPNVRFAPIGATPFRSVLNPIADICTRTSGCERVERNGTHATALKSSAVIAKNLSACERDPGPTQLKPLFLLLLGSTERRSTLIL